MTSLCVSGAVNTQGFVWKFLCGIYTVSFIRLFNNSSMAATVKRVGLISG